MTDIDLIANTLLYRGLISPEDREIVVEVLKGLILPPAIESRNGTLYCTDCGIVECADLQVSKIDPKSTDGETLIEFRYHNEHKSFLPTIARTIDGHMRNPLQYLKGKQMKDITRYLPLFQCPNCQKPLRVQ